jgi:diaminopimelate epimerase
MKIRFSKYQAAGNDFIIINEISQSYNLSQSQIANLCHRRFGIGADGLIRIRKVKNAAFEMLYYNSDGRLASMCGNGGRSVAHYAHKIGLFSEYDFFIAQDGEHYVRFYDGGVSLKMQNVVIPQNYKTDIFDTGSPHIVIEAPDLFETDIILHGRNLRYDSQYSPQGCNVNFIKEKSQNEIFQRTYERGVEDETYACGTGAVAAAVYQAIKYNYLGGFECLIHMKGGDLFVKLNRKGESFENVWLSGPAVCVFDGDICDINIKIPKFGD